MKIAINTRLLIRNKLEGIGWFTYETLRRITKNHPEVQFYFLFDREPDASFIFESNVFPIVLFPQARHPFLFVIWFELSVARALRKIKPDLFLSPDGYLSLSTKVPSLAVMHDLNFEHFPKDLPWLVRCYYRFFFPRFARKAIRLATVSQFSKRDIAEKYNIDPDKVDVVFNGANEMFVPLDDAEINLVRVKYSDGKPYFLFVGSLHPRKNLARLFESFDLFRAENETNVKLVVVGEKKWWTKPISDAFEKMDHKEEVVFCGRLDSNELHRITAAALAITYVSYFEGFGIPIAEAFRCGVPVITSNVTSMPEVAGDAALLIDPYNINSIASAMALMVKDEKLRAELIRKGFERAGLFTWDGAASRLWESMMHAYRESKNTMNT